MTEAQTGVGLKKLTHEGAEQIGRELFKRAGIGGEPDAWMSVIADYGKSIVPELALDSVETVALLGVLLYKDMSPVVPKTAETTARRLALVDKLNREHGQSQLCADMSELVRGYAESAAVLDKVNAYFAFLDKAMPAVQATTPAGIVLQSLDRAWLNGADTIAAHEDDLRKAYIAAKYPERTAVSDRAAFLTELKAIYERTGQQTRTSRNADTLLRKYEATLLSMKGSAIYA